MVSVVAVAMTFPLLAVTTGATLATGVRLPLLIPSVMTTAESGPAVGFVVKVTVSDVAVALVTRPAPDDRITRLLPGVVASKPAPVMLRVVELAARFAVLALIPGITDATCVVALDRLSVVTVALRGPTAGGVVNVRVS
jgi:hypothetical protein